MSAHRRAVFGVVAVVVKMDDAGLHLTQSGSRIAQQVGRGLVAGMPKLLSTLSAVGTVAMLWVGGHLLLVGSDGLGWHGPYGLVHHAEDRVRHSVKAFGAVEHRRGLVRRLHDHGGWHPPNLSVNTPSGVNRLIQPSRSLRSATPEALRTTATLSFVMSCSLSQPCGSDHWASLFLKPSWSWQSRRRRCVPGLVPIESELDPESLHDNEIRPMSDWRSSPRSNPVSRSRKIGFGLW
jgi:hypothetical protein